ncbi:hypothetical protein BKA69DRAFT_1040708 [Paraphysoderma sedebokerense]|nr:hypothetical protein BKA69DRAFT_1040708 [Paraphysoderma sedebokerense]
MPFVLNRPSIIMAMMAVLGVALPLVNSSRVGAPVNQAGITDRIKFNAPNLFPETIEFDGKDFLLSSITQSVISKLTFDGKISTFINDTSVLGNSSFGMEIDSRNGRLLVTYSDFTGATSGKPSPFVGLGAYNLKTGDKIYLADLSNVGPGTHMSNDVTVDKEGNAYVTDNVQGLVWKVSKDGSKSEVFANDPILKAGVDFSPSPLALNVEGIEYHPDNFLIIGNFGAKKLFKIDIETRKSIEIEGAADILKSGGFVDGIFLRNRNELIVVAGPVLHYLQSADGSFQKVDLVRQVPIDGSAFPVAGLLAKPGFDSGFNSKLGRRNGQNTFYVLEAHLDKLLGGQNQSEFAVANVDLGPVKQYFEEAGEDEVKSSAGTVEKFLGITLSVTLSVFFYLM